MKLHTALLYTASVGLTSAQNYGRLDWVPSPTPHKDVQYLGMSAINKDLVWLSGTNGTIVRTTDGGAHWVDIPSPLKPEEKDSVTLKAVHAFSDHFAVVLASGKGGKSRIFLTGNAGQRWRETFTNTEDAANYQCMAFGNTDGQRAWGVAASDPVNGRLRLVLTIDAGETWNPISQTNIPDAEQGERLLDEVSSCVTFGPLQLAIATAGTKTGRVYATTNQNFALGWLATNTNLTGGADGGASTVQFSADGLNAIAVGGRLSGSTENDTVATWSTNGGYQWNYGASERNTFLSDVSWAPLRKGLAVAVGPGGSVFTRDGGKSWGGVGNDSLSVVSCNDQDMCWAAGANGMAAKLDLSGLTF